MPRSFPGPHPSAPREPAPRTPSGGEGEQEGEREEHDITFSLLWLRMLLDGFELAEALPKDTGDHPIPKRLWGTLRQGKVPSRATLAKLSPDLRHELRLQTGSACGFRMLAAMGEEEVCRRASALQAMEGEGSTLGGCLLLILSLVLTVPPSEAMVAQLTAHYSDRAPDLERVEGFLEELMVALLARTTQELMAQMVEREGIDPEDLLGMLQGDPPPKR